MTAATASTSATQPTATPPMTTKLLKLLILAVGLSCFSAKGQSRFTRYVTNVADLVAVNPNGNDRLYMLLGRDAVNDGGGGPVLWTPGSTATTNLGTVFASQNALAPPGRFVRQFTGDYEAAWFGVKPDAATDNYRALTNALGVIVSADGGALRL